MKPISTNPARALALLLSAVFVLGLVFFLFGAFPLAPANASPATATNIGSVATTTAATSVTVSARIMATTTNPLDPIGSYNRVYAVICNPNANPVFLNLDGDKETSFPLGKATTVIAAAAGYDACFEITDRNAYNGSVTASSTNQTATIITVKQYVQ